MNKRKKDIIEQDLAGKNLKKLNRIFIAVFTLLVIGLYGNTYFNHFSLDDGYLVSDNPGIQKGIRGIPDIFTSFYATDSGGKTFGYRPLVRTTFAIEMDLTGINPGISHAINVILYLLMILILFKVLKRLFRGYNIFFPFLITIIFIAHPVHTEIVASLKNRDEILAFGFALLALDYFLKFIDFKKQRFLIWGVFFYLLAFLSKASVFAFLLVIPLIFYFFTNIKLKNIIILALAFIGMALFAAFFPKVILPDMSRPIEMVENPLAFNTSLWDHLGTGLYIILYYLRLLFYPHPLVFYYGYNMVPVVSLGNIWVILSLVIYSGMFVYAIMRIKSKNALSFAILLYMVTIAMYSNILVPIPGIIAERFLLIPSLGFSIAIVYLLFLLFRANLKGSPKFNTRMAGVSLIVLIILIPYAIKTYSRNIDWRTNFSLYKADLPYLENSVKAHDFYAEQLMRQVNEELKKPVDVTKFLRPTINEAIMHWEKAVEILPSHYSSWTNLGIIYSRIYKEHDDAILCFEEALKYKPDHGKALFNLGQALEAKGQLEDAILRYEECIKYSDDAINPRSRLSNVYFMTGNYRKAIELNEEIMQIDPDEPLPYVNFGNYYMNRTDTVKAISFYEQAVVKGAPAQVSIFLMKYFDSKGEINKRDHYKAIAQKQMEGSVVKP